MTARSRKEQIEEMLAADPDDPFLRYGLAMEYRSAGQDEEAVRCLEDLVRVAPGYVPAYLQLGQTLIRLDREQEARAALTAGIDVAQRAGDAHAAGEMAGFLEGIS